MYNNVSSDRSTVLPFVLGIFCSWVPYRGRCWSLLQVDLTLGQVTTLAGTGAQGEDKQGGNQGTQQALSTPWDVATGVSPGNLASLSIPPPPPPPPALLLALESKTDFKCIISLSVSVCLSLSLSVSLSLSLSLWGHCLLIKSWGVHLLVNPSCVQTHIT